MTTTETQVEVAELTTGEAINRALDEALSSGEPIMHLGQDIGAHGVTPISDSWEQTVEEGEAHFREIQERRVKNPRREGE
jgi:hypothetical protein